MINEKMVLFKTNLIQLLLKTNFQKKESKLELKPIEKKYNHSDEYFDRFLPLILEEARYKATETYNSVVSAKRKDFFQISFQVDKRNSQSITFQIDNPFIEVKSYHYLMFFLQTTDNEIYFGIVTDSRIEEKTLVASADVAIPDNFFFNEAKIYFSESITPLVRMFEATIFCRKFSPKIFDFQTIDSKKILKENTVFVQSDLNPSQKKAVCDFLSAESGLHLWQGPPGTGKTKTIVGLLTELSKRKENARVLICATSNKAIQVLLKRFLKENLEQKIAFSASDMKVPDELLPYVTDSFPYVYKAKIKKISDLVEELPTSLEVLKKEVDFLIEMFRFIPLERGSFLNDLQIINEELNKKNINKDKIENCLFNLNKRYLPDEITIFNQAYFIFMTTSISAREKISSMAPIDILILDEASQCIEPEIFIPMRFFPDKILLVGDPNQLPAVIKSPEALRNNLDQSMMTRLMLNGYPYQLLETQYRMHPEISYFPGKKYYDAQLKDDESVKQVKSGMPYQIIHVNGKENFKYLSYQNSDEANLIVDEILKMESKDEIAVITFYQSQASLIQFILNKRDIDKKYQNITITTPDEAQGSEWNHVLISFVRANETEKIGFLADFRRLNVALTRAKKSLKMFGHIPTLLNSEEFQALFKDAEERKLLFVNTKKGLTLTSCNEIKNRTKKSENVNSPVISYKANTPPLCKFFFTTGCVRGEKCTFSHIAQPKK